MSHRFDPHLHTLLLVCVVGLAGGAGCAARGGGAGGAAETSSTSSGQETARTDEAADADAERRPADDGVAGGEGDTLGADAPAQPSSPMMLEAPESENMDVPPHDTVAPRATVSLLRQLDRVETNLPDALSAGRCDDAAGIRDHMCALATRICTLAREVPEDPRVDDRCEDARRRCQSATDRVEDRCGG